MKTFTLERSTVLPYPRERVFDFFAEAKNLEDLTPPWLRFRILTPRPIRMCEGALIDYRLRVHGIPLSWRSEITVWEPPYRFVDEQRRGPYREWVHTHTFEPHPAGTRIADEVRYRLPLWPAGELAHPVVRAQLGRIFGFRGEAIRQALIPGRA